MLCAIRVKQDLNTRMRASVPVLRYRQYIAVIPEFHDTTIEDHNIEETKPKVI